MSDEERDGVPDARPPRVLTVPFGRPFLTVLAEAILAGNLPDAGGRTPGPLDLPDLTILLPTRRAARARCWR